MKVTQQIYDRLEKTKNNSSKSSSKKEDKGILEEFWDWLTD